MVGRKNAKRGGAEKRAFFGTYEQTEVHIEVVTTQKLVWDDPYRVVDELCVLSLTCLNIT